MDKPPLWTDEKVELVVGGLLRIGVLVSAAVVFGGGILYLVHHGAAPPDYRVFHGEPTDLRTLNGIIKDALSLRGRGLIQLGLLMLIATPVARVALSVTAFALQRDRVYVFVTLAVLVILLFGLWGGHL